MDFTNVFNVWEASRIGKLRAIAAFIFGACILCASMLTVTPAYAATLDEPIVISDPGKSASGDGWEWVPAGSSGTLTLEHADIRVADARDAEAAIVVPDGATIHLKGENAVVMTADSPAVDNLLAAIYCAGHLTIIGDSEASAVVTGEGQMDWGVVCEGGLSVTGPISLDVTATTVGYGGDDAAGATGVYVRGDLVIDNGASMSVIGSANGLIVTRPDSESAPGTTTISGAGSIKLGTKNKLPNSLAASFEGDVLISDTESVLVSGSATESWAPMAISGSKVEFDVSVSDHALFAQRGLDIVDGSQVKIASKGHALYVLEELNVANSELHVEGVGVWSTAIRVEGDVTVDNASVAALTNVGEGTKGISIMNSAGSDLAGTLTLKGSPSIVAQGAQAAIQFVSMGADEDGVHVVLDPSIGAVEGGALRYAERTFTSPDEFTMSIWSYADDPIGISDDFGLEGASQRVEIGIEHSLLYVTDNGNAVTGLQGIAAIASDGTEYPAEEWLDGSHVGYYRFAKDLPAGTYCVSFGSGYETADAARIEVPEDGSMVFAMDFHSIEVEDVNHAHTWLIEPSTGKRVSSLAHVLHGAKVEIGTEVDDAHRFVSYEATGEVPDWENGDSSKAGQTITVRGDASIKATVAVMPPVVPGLGSECSGPEKSGSSSLPATGDPTGAFLVAAIAAAGLTAVLLAMRMCER